MTPSPAPERRIQSSTLRHLELVFTPPGLPLVSKFEDADPTTAVLVRGPAGAGKSSLAFAVARDLALSGQGAVLYLTTEAFPADVVYKADLFGVSRDQVLLWEAQDRAGPGAICVRHLAVEEDALAEDALTTQERSALALGAVQSLLTRWAGPVPVRAVVIDAFGLPEPTSAEAYALRTAALTWVQSLETRGISAVLIEESGLGASDALTFVVDVVFDLRFDEPSPGAELQRRLRVTKSRFSASDPGPHELGLEQGRPAVWPDLIAVSAETLRARYRSGAEPRSVLFNEGWNYCVPVGGGDLVTLEPDRQFILDAVLEASPSCVVLNVQLGPKTRVFRGAELVDVLEERTGPAPLAMGLLEIARRQEANTLIISGLFGWLLERPRYRVGLPRMLEVLRDAGLLVFVVGSLRPWTELRPFFDVDMSKPTRKRCTLLEAEKMPWWLLVESRGKLGEHLGLRPYIESGGITAQAQQEIELLFEHLPGRPPWQQPPSWDEFQRAVGSAWRMIPGAWQRWAQLLNCMPDLSAPIDDRQPSSIWIAVLQGRLENVVSRWLAWATKQAVRSVWLHRVGTFLVALFSQDMTTIASLEHLLDVVDMGREVANPAMARVLMRYNGEEAVRRLISHRPEQTQNLIMAMLYLDQGRIGDTKKAKDLLRAIDDRNWRLDAHTYYLRGIAHRQLGEIDKAMSAWRRTLEINPHYTLAQQRLAE